MTGRLAGNLVVFGRVLRAAGLHVTPEQTRLFASALEQLGPDHRQDVRAAGRVIYAQSRDDAMLFDRAFDLFWQRSLAEGAPSGRLPRLKAREDLRPPPPRDSGAAIETAADALPVVRGLAPSAVERLRTRDFSDLSADEARDALRMIDRLAPRVLLRPSRRHLPARRGTRLAMRSMMRHALATGGVPLDWRWLRRTVRPRPLVVVCDISGSMEVWSRFLLRFAHALRRTGAPVEVFVFGTRLTRITRELRHRDWQQAVRRAAAMVTDWNGGTRIGASLHDLNRRWVRRAVRSGAVVMIVSDGWERDDPAVLAVEMAVLRRSCHRLIWLNPLAHQPGFAPATRGLQAALPYVDAFLPCGTLGSLEELAGLLVREGAAGTQISRIAQITQM